MLILKSSKEIELMRESGKILYAVMQSLIKNVRPGITTQFLDEVAKKEVLKYNASCSFKGYEGYPAHICTSINEEIVHGIPSPDRVLKEGDIIGIDAGVIFKGYHSDMARTLPVGKISSEAKHLIDTGKKCFFDGISQFMEGNRLYDISSAIEKTARENGYAITKELTGHGIGKSLHEDPSIPNYKPAGFGVRLKVGMTLAIEPMINAGAAPVKWERNGWTVRTADRSLSTHYENTVALTDNGVIILTAP